MGVIQHHAIIVTHGGYGTALTEAHEHAVRLGMLVSPIATSPVNGYKHFAVFPDGSKEFWAESKQGDEQRAALVAWLGERDALRWVEVAYGELGYEVTAHTNDSAEDD